MNILLNASNLRTGGGIQVADSIIRLLRNYPNHNFTVVISKQLDTKELKKLHAEHVKFITYSQPLSLFHVFTGRDKVLDKIVKDKNIDVVLTVFGPSRWRPKCKHVCGFAMPHIVLNDSPYWQTISLFNRVKSKFRIKLMKRDFRKNNEILWCENEYISQRLRDIFPDKKVVTITNNYNQIFDNPLLWDFSIKIPPFDGITLLTITANYPHKNLEIALPALKEIMLIDPNVKVRFVFSISKEEYKPIPPELKDHFVFLGPIKINQCPPLYQQANILLQPSLLECFSASYAEAMRMRIPIITTDLGFAHSLCGDAAVYYNPTDPKSLAKCIIELCNNPDKMQQLVLNGIEQLKRYDTASMRTEKLIKVCENINITQ